MHQWPSSKSVDCYDITAPDDFAGMRRAGQLAATTLDFVTPGSEHSRAG